MRIGFDGTPLLGQRSGVGYYTGNLLAALMEVEPEWDYLLYSNRPLNGLEPPLPLAQRGNQRYFAPSRWLWMQTILPATIRHSRPHLCHFTNALAPLRLPAPYVLTIHDASLFVYGQFHPWARHLTMRLTLPIITRRAAAIITVSHHSRNEIIRHLEVDPDKIHVVYEAAADYFRPVHEPKILDALRQKYELPEQYVLYVGTLEPRKNLGRLLHAVKQVREAGMPHQLVLVGGKGWMMDSFDDEVRALGIQDAVHTLGYIPSADLPGLYSMATVFAFPSLYEGFGLPPLEAMACGAPVLSSRSSSLAEVCGDAAYLVNPLDTDAIAEGLGALLSDEALREKLRCKGLERAAAFSWRRAALETVAVYRRALQTAS